MTKNHTITLTKKLFQRLTKQFGMLHCYECEQPFQIGHTVMAHPRTKSKSVQGTIYYCLQCWDSHYY
jgi:RNase P subunit RPR2